jgi:DNA invertase Pin-like site-specific DNA recombinase
MTTRFLPKPQIAVLDPWNFTLPIEVLWAIYARQSTPGQVIKYTESTEMQTDDLIKWLQVRGVRNNYHLFDADLGLSGTLRIDERPDLQEMIRRINADEIKAVLVYQISRLFRDLTGIQYNTFADDCKQHNCILVTAYDGMVYNFNNPIHLKMFRFLAEAAAEYLQQQIGLLQEARLRRARNGFYVHMGNIPSGFLVDYDKDSPTFRKLIPYLPHREIILETLYRRYYSLCGDFSAICREIDSMPYVFPLFEQWVDHRIVNQWKRRRRNGGYSLTRKGIITIMTNPANIGWWIVQGDIISRENHERLIPPEEEYLFWYAFERLNSYTTEGEKNEQQIINIPKRFYQRDTDPTEGLLKDRITSPNAKVRVHLKRGSQHYAIIPKDQSIYIKDMREIDARLIDSAFVDVFFAHLRETCDLDEYREWIATETRNHEGLVGNLASQLRKIDDTQDAILSEILAIHTQIKETAATDEERKRLEADAASYIAGLRAKYQSLDKPKKEVSDKLHREQTSKRYETLKQFSDFQTELEKLIPVWTEKPFPIRKEFINLFVDEAILTNVSSHWLQLDIYWSHPQWEVERLYIPRKRGTRPEWTVEERTLLYEYYPTERKDLLLQMLPQKNWGAIVKMAGILGIQRTIISVYPIPLHLSWEDLVFMQEHNIPLNRSEYICKPLSFYESDSEEPAIYPNCACELWQRTRSYR